MCRQQNVGSPRLEEQQGVPGPEVRYNEEFGGHTGVQGPQARRPLPAGASGPHSATGASEAGQQGLQAAEGPALEGEEGVE